jgi:hypothetical protein
VAPQGQPQGDLVLRNLHDALKDDRVAKDLEDRTGLSREQLEQFATKFQKPKSGPAEPGREIEVKPGEQEPAKPAANLPGVDSTRRFNRKISRDAGSLPQDTIHNNVEGFRFDPPPEWRGKWEGYKSKLARSQVTAKRSANAKTTPAPGSR